LPFTIKLYNMKIYSACWVLLYILCMLPACKKSQGDVPQPTLPAISGINPGSGPVSTPVTISGSNFGIDASKVKVFFNGVTATVQSGTNTEIVALVPDNATTGKVSVVINGQNADGPDFTVTIATPSKPSITGINPASGSKNTVVTITGTNFGTDASKVTVLFNGVAATVQSVSNTTMVALAPVNGSTGTVKITVNAQAVDGPIFTYVTGVNVTTVAGGDVGGFADGAGSAALFNKPVGIAADGQGNLFVTDETNQRIRKITAGGVVTTFAGSAQQGINDGTGSAAQFYDPQGIASDAQGNLAVVDSRSYLIRRITPGAVVTTLAGNIILGFTDGTGSAAQFYTPTGVALDLQGNVYVADWGNHAIRKITPAGVVTTLAGNGTPGFADGTGGAARFNHPYGLTVDAQGNVFVADENHSIRKITAAGVVTTFAGNGSIGHADGNGSAARFFFPSGLALDAQGNIYVADRGNHSIRKITPAGIVSTVAGTVQGYADGDASTARFNQPYGLTLDVQGNIYVADYLNFRIRKITLQ
jgi:sugar lactone lactonase YvrE